MFGLLYWLLCTGTRVQNPFVDLSGRDEFDRSTSQVRARVKFQSRVKSIFLFDVFGSFVFNCRVKIMHQRHKNSKI